MSFRNWKTITVIAVIVVVIAVVGMMFWKDIGAFLSSSIELPMSEEDYKAECVEISQATLLRNPDNYKGKKYKVTGEIMKYIGVEDDFSEGTYLCVDYTGSKYSSQGVYTINWYIEHKQGSKDRYLQGDIVTFYGTFTDIGGYEDLLGGKHQIPILTAKYYEIKKD